MADATNDIDQIRRRMAQIRMELHDDVQGVVAGGEAATDWKYYVRLYPWAALAGAVVVGYLVVPRKRHPQDESSAVASGGSRGGTPARHEIKEEKQEARRTSGLMGLALGFLGPIVTRAAQNYASHYVTSWIETQSGAFPGAEAAPGMTPESGLPPEPGAWGS